MEKSIKKQQERIERLSDLYQLKHEAGRKHDSIIDYINGSFGDAFPDMKRKWQHEAEILRSAIGRINDRIAKQIQLISSNQ